MKEEDSAILGTVSDVLQTGANDVYVVALADGGEVLLPAIKDCILSVDMEKERCRCTCWTVCCDHKAA